MNIFAQTNDYSAVPQQLKDQLNERYPGAKRAELKTGGDFPFLSRSDEVNLYLQVLQTHLLFPFIVISFV
jgi:maspardin